MLESGVTAEGENEVFLSLQVPSLRSEDNYEKFKEGLSEALGFFKEKGLFHIIAKQTETVVKSQGFTRASPVLIKGGDHG